MKELVIKGKRTKNILVGLSSIADENKREVLQNVPVELQNIKTQYELLRIVYYDEKKVNQSKISTDENIRLLNRELNAKLNGYKQQDVKKKLYDEITFITIEELRKKLIDELMTCIFCGKQVKLLYDKVRDDTQWTLDRIDNDCGHSDDNTCIACLKCNLQRRRTDYDKFHWTKNFTITKVDDVKCDDDLQT